MNISTTTSWSALLLYARKCAWQSNYSKPYILHVYISFGSHTLLLCDHWCGSYLHKHCLQQLLPEESSTSCGNVLCCGHFRFIVIVSCQMWQRRRSTAPVCPAGWQVEIQVIYSTHTSCFLCLSRSFCSFSCVSLACVRHLWRASWLLWESQITMHCNRSLSWKMVIVSKWPLKGFVNIDYSLHSRHNIYSLLMVTWVNAN